MAKDRTRDAMHCHEMAMEMVKRVNAVEETVTPEIALVAAATAAPEDEITEEAGAPAFAASCVVLLCAYISTLLF